jgi:fructose-specific phosphotransferase system IIC component
MIAGVTLPLLAYFMSHGTTNSLAQRDAIVLALLGVALAMAGAALYLKGALAGFLRFWLVRDLHERRAQTDRLLESRGGGDQGPEGEPT